MKKKMPYKKRLYGLVAVILGLCFVLSVLGMTGLNARILQQDMGAQIEKLEKNSKSYLKNIQNSMLESEESTFQSALQLSQLSDSVNQGGIGTHYTCREDDQIVLESGNTTFLHYYSTYEDEDGDTVYMEELQLLLDLDAYLNEQELEEISEICDQDKEAIILADGCYDGITMYPAKIWVIKPASDRDDTIWKSANGMRLLADQDAQQYTVAWEKEISEAYDDGQEIPSEMTVQSESYFLSDERKESLSASRLTEGEEGHTSNLLEVTGTGKVKTGKHTAVTYYYTGRPLEKAVKQLWIVYLLLVVFYILAAVVLYSVMHLMFCQQEQWNWNQKMLTRAIAHELKTPISIIQGYCEGLLLQKDRAKQEEYLRIITQETKEMDRLVLDMLELSKLETTGYQLEMEEIELNELVHAVVRQYESIYQERGITLTVQGEKEVLFEGDLSCMYKAVSNLIGNAIKHAREQGNVIVTIEQEQDRSYLRIYNDGPEIEENIRMHIWDGFYTVQKENKSGIRSTGLGLTIVKHMMEMHGFSYGCDNKNQGVEFWIGIKNE